MIRKSETLTQAVATSSMDGRIKGILENAYGPDAAPLTQEMVRKLGTHASE